MKKLCPTHIVNYNSKKARAAQGPLSKWSILLTAIRQRRVSHPSSVKLSFTYEYCRRYVVATLMLLYSVFAVSSAYRNNRNARKVHTSLVRLLVYLQDALPHDSDLGALVLLAFGVLASL